MSEVITLDRVSKTLGSREILKNVSFSVQSGDIFGYLGPNGAGKTTTIRILLGLMAPTSGRATVLGVDAQSEKARQKVGFVLETDGLYDNLSAFDNLMYYTRIYGLQDSTERIKWVIALVGLEDRIQDKVGSYSKGMRQRLALARALVHDPAVLILDEPTAGVDPTGQIEIRQIMLDRVHREGRTILLSSHNLDEVQRICNRIALIHRGEIRLFGDLESLQREMSRGEVVIETVEPVPGDILAELGRIPEVKIQNQHNRTLTLNMNRNADVSGVIAFLTARNVRIEQVKRQEASLEEIYTRIMKEAEQK